MKIADIHAHIFPEKLAEKASHSIGSFYGVPIEREADMPRLCAEDKLAGITRCAVSNSATNASQVRNANTFLAEAVRGHDGYLAFGTIYPGMDGFEEELDRMLELGLRGVKIHPDFQKLAIDDERGIETYRAIARRDLPVLFHMGDDRYDFSSPERLTNLLRRVPELPGLWLHTSAAGAAGRGRWLHLQPESVLYDTSSTLGMIDRDMVLLLHRRDRPRPADLRHGLSHVEPKGGTEQVFLPWSERERPAKDFVRKFHEIIGPERRRIKKRGNTHVSDRH